MIHFRLPNLTGWALAGAVLFAGSLPIFAQCGSPGCVKLNGFLSYPLTLTAYPINGGSVTASPSSPDGRYAPGTVVTLTPTASPGYTFAGFSGDITGTTLPATVTLNGPRSVVANFQQVFPPVTAGARFVASSPCRLVDTRSGLGNSGLNGPPSIDAAQTRIFPVLSSGCSIPSSVLAYLVNVTVLPAKGLSYLTVWAAGQPQPTVSTLNAFAGGVVSNQAIVPAGTNGSIAVYATDKTDVVIDLIGYFDPQAAAGLSFYPLAPCRVTDTRLGSNGPDFAAGETRTIYPSSGSCGIPTTAQAVSTNVTVAPEEPLGYLTLFQAGQVQPLVSTLNSLDSRTVANAAVVSVSAGGGLNVYSTNKTQVILDANGYFAPPGAAGALQFYPVAPCRVADTRIMVGGLGGPTIQSGMSRDFPVQGSSCGIPLTAKAYALNVTAIPTGPLGYLTVWPTGQVQPYVSTLNSDGRVVANSAIVPAGANGSVSVYVSNTSDVVLDIEGYFAP